MSNEKEKCAKKRNHKPVLKKSEKEEVKTMEMKEKKEKLSLLELSGEKVQKRIDEIFKADRGDQVIVASCMSYDGLSEKQLLYASIKPYDSLPDDLIRWTNKDFAKWLIKKIFTGHKYKDLKARAVKIRPEDAKPGDVAVLKKDALGRKEKFVVTENLAHVRDLRVAKGKKPIYSDPAEYDDPSMMTCLKMEKSGAFIPYEDIKYVLTFYTDTDAEKN